MKPRKKPVKLPSSLIASRKVRKVMPPPMKVHKGELRKLDDISTRILGDPHDGNQFEDEDFRDGCPNT